MQDSWKQEAAAVLTSTVVTNLETAATTPNVHALIAAFADADAALAKHRKVASAAAARAVAAQRECAARLAALRRRNMELLHKVAAGAQRGASVDEARRMKECIQERVALMGRLDALAAAEVEVAEVAEEAEAAEVAEEAEAAEAAEAENRQWFREMMRAAESDAVRPCSLK
jgi:hypothetical protein